MNYTTLRCNDWTSYWKTREGKRRVKYHNYLEARQQKREEIEEEIITLKRDFCNLYELIDNLDKKVNKPKSKEEALEILKKLNNSKHYLISSVCISKNGTMVWNYSDQSELKMKNFKEDELIKYLDKIKINTLLAYGVYQVEADGLNLFEYIKGDQDSIMGLPIQQIMEYIKQQEI